MNDFESCFVISDDVKFFFFFSFFCAHLLKPVYNNIRNQKHSVSFFYFCFVFVFVIVFVFIVFFYYWNQFTIISDIKNTLFIFFFFFYCFFIVFFVFYFLKSIYNNIRNHFVPHTVIQKQNAMF
jgi:hypothetical protein